MSFEADQEMLRRRFEAGSEPKSLEQRLRLLSTDDAVQRSRERAIEMLRNGTYSKKPFLTAADLVMLREMKIGLIAREAQ